VLCCGVQVGTVVDDPLEQNNLSKGQRRATLTEQLLVDSELTTTRKRRFNKLQVRVSLTYTAKPACLGATLLLPLLRARRLCAAADEVFSVCLRRLAGYCSRALSESYVVS
jgi:hypothetical protein